MAATTIDFYFDFMSPYAYLAHTRLPALAARRGAQLRYRPIDLDRAKLAIGNTAPANRDLPIKHRYLRVDLARWAQAYGVPFTPPAGYGSARLNRGAFLAIEQGCATRYVDCAWRRLWGGGGGAMDDDALLSDLAREMGWPADEFLAYVQSDAARERLEASNEEALARGVFGVPTMMVGDALWWGNDRLHFLDMHLQQQMPS